MKNPGCVVMLAFLAACAAVWLADRLELWPALDGLVNGPGVVVFTVLVVISAPVAEALRRRK